MTAKMGGGSRRPSVFSARKSGGVQGGKHDIDSAFGRSAGSRASSLQQQRQRAAFWFLAPMMVALFCVAAWPLLRTIWFSLTDTSLNNLYGGKWIGFDNYLQVRTLSNRQACIWRGTLVDPAWWNAVWNTVRFAVVSVLVRNRARA